MPNRTPTRGDAATKPTITRRATSAGTARYAERWAYAFVPDFFRSTSAGLTISSLAVGTYLGESDDQTDAQYESATIAALASGINVVDTAINYRCQRSERAIGRALQQLIGDGKIQRDEVVICTKAGYVPLDGSPPSSREKYEEYLRREYFNTGVLTESELVGGGHALSPAFLIDQLERSRKNLGVQSIDCLYLHNPEQQLAAITPTELAARLRRAFETLESCVANGTIGSYGCATWNGLRLPAGSQGHLSLVELVTLARDVAGPDHHFRFVQLPVNLTMSEAIRVSTQRDPRGRLAHVTDLAAELGVDLVVSAPLLQGQLTQGLPESVKDLFSGTTDAQRALAFARSIPAAATVAVGMRRREHVEENLAGVRASLPRG